MKKMLVCAVLVVLCAAAPLAAQNKPHIMVNTNVGMGNRNWVSIDSGGKFAEFRNLAQQAGYTVDDEFLTSITAEKLTGVDILILAMPELQLETADKQALRTFIQNGGGVLITADDTSVYPWVNPENLNSFIKQFGVEFGQRDSFDRDALVPNGSPLDYPENVNSAQSFEGRYLINVNTAQAIKAATLENGSTWAAIPFVAGIGKGRLVVMGESRWLTDDPGVNQIGAADNEKLARNLLAFLAGGGYDLSVIKARLKGRNLMPGDKVQAICRISNVSKFYSPSAKAQFVVNPDGAVEPAEETVLLTAPITDLAPGKKIKIKKKLKLPASLGPGEYTLTVRIIGAAGDINASNNTKVGKKLIIN